MTPEETPTGIAQILARAKNVVVAILSFQIKLSTVLLAGVVVGGILYFRSGKSVIFPNETTEPPKLGISDFVRDVKSELVRADSIAQANHEAALFKLGDFDLEISFTVQAQRSEKGSMNYKFVTLEGQASAGSEKVQKLKLHWTAIPPTAETIKPNVIPIDSLASQIDFIDTPEVKGKEYEKKKHL